MMDLHAVRFVPNTKISHDYHGDQVDTFSYGHLINKNVPYIGIPAKQNRLVIIDVDSAEMGGHKKDGREWWGQFHKENGLPPTYTVRTRSGGWHFYYKLPDTVNEDVFAPPGTLADGVDVKYNGWVAAPPTIGYDVYWGSIGDIAVAPPSLMAEFTRRKMSGNSKQFDSADPYNILHLHTSYSEDQVSELRRRIGWFQKHGSLSRDEWRDGLFSLKAGLPDSPEILEELSTMWTMNAAYQTGDEFEAADIIERASNEGRIGPGTIYALLRSIEMRENAPAVSADLTKEQVLEKARVRWKQNNEGGIRISASESNAGSLVGAIYPVEDLYYDCRKDQYMFKQKALSDAELTNIVTPLIQSEAFGLGVEKLSKATISQGIEILMQSRKLDPHKEYLKNVNWDGIPRIETFFPKYVRVEDSTYSRAVSKNFWVALVARSLRPGCQFDSMVILEGAEGIRKSSLFRAIAGEYFYAPSTSKAFKDLDELRNMHQAILVEIPELLGMDGNISREVKSFLSLEQDTIRAPYARKSVKHKRGFIFVGTTNEANYLTAEMGDRRFWPLFVPGTDPIDTDKIIADRDQLFAEAVAHFNVGITFYEVPSEAHLAATADKRQNDPIRGVVKRILAMSGGYETTEGVYKKLNGEGLLQGGLTMKNAARLQAAMMKEGWTEIDGAWSKE